MESYTKAKPVDLPPPKLVRKPKHETTSGVTLYILASFSEISFLGTEDLPGCKTSTTYRKHILHFSSVSIYGFNNIPSVSWPKAGWS